MARDFDSTNPDYIDFGNPSYLDITTAEMTMAVLIRPGPTGGGQHNFFSKWSNAGSEFSYIMAKDTLNETFASMFTGGVYRQVNSGTIMTVDVWHHIAAVYDGSNFNFYFNGVFQASSSATGNVQSSTAPLRLGAGGSGAAEDSYDGALGHAGIWDVGLSASEVASLAAGASPRRIRSDDLLYYATLNGQNPEADVVGANTGTINGSPAVAEEPPIPNSIVAP